MESNFHDMGWRPRTVLREQVEAENAMNDRDRVLGAVVGALEPFRSHLDSEVRSPDLHGVTLQ
jgi:hypothetical protein